jgi:hypothetical protein
MCHYAQLTFPVPAVMVVLLYPPLAALVLPVKPAPIVIVLESGYLRITTPEPPEKAVPVHAAPPPPPVLTVPLVPGTPDPLVPLPPPPKPPLST